MRQLLLWVIEDTESHLIEIHYLDGRRRIIDTASPEDREAFSDMNVLFAGFVERYDSVSRDANPTPLQPLTATAGL